MALIDAIPPDILERAWGEEVPNGQTKTIDGIYRVTKHPKGKMVLVTRRSAIDALGPFVTTDIVVFPRPEDKQHFAKASKFLRECGPAEDNPGSVGSIRLTTAGFVESPLNVSHAQSHYMTRDQKPLRPEQAERLRSLGREEKLQSAREGGLPREYARKYGGWYEHAIREAIKIAGEQGRELQVHRTAFRRGGEEFPGGPRDKRLPRFYDALVRVCKKEGVRPQRKRGMFSIKTRPRPCPHV